MGNIPINRVVAFAGPYLAVISGALADWLIVHLHVLNLFHTTNTQVASAITQLGVFGLTALLVWAGHQKWLTGWQKYESEVLNAIDPVLTIPTPTPAAPIPTPTPAPEPAPTTPTPVTPAPENPTPTTEVKPSTIVIETPTDT